MIAAAWMDLIIIATSFLQGGEEGGNAGNIWQLKAFCCIGDLHGCGVCGGVQTGGEDGLIV